MNNQKNEIFGIHRTTLLIFAVAITFGSFSVYKALGGGTSTVDRTERSEVPAVARSVSGTALTASVDVTVTNTNPLASATRLTNTPRPAAKTELTPIEQIQVGDRVFAESPTGEEDTAFGSEIIPSDWRKLTLRAPKRDGTIAEVVLLRPVTWLNEQHGEVGGTVFISVPECGIDGNAQVLAIDPCPEIPSGAGRVVTGTFLHHARSTITLTITGQSESIGCTGNHPFWSEDRQAFVRADSLQPNETLRTATGLTTVESWTPDLNPTPVYNIEVHGAHVYHVGTSGVVVHNPGGLSILDNCPWLPGGSRFALGKNIGLKDFAEGLHARTWNDFPKGTHWQSGVWNELNNPNTRILVNLDGVQDVYRNILKPTNGFEWEMQLIFDNKQWWDRITWFKNGSVVANPF